MSARHSRPSPSSPVTTRSLCSSCCRKCASSPSISPRTLSSVKVRCRVKVCPASLRCCHGLWRCRNGLKEFGSHLYQSIFSSFQWVCQCSLQSLQPIPCFCSPLKAFTGCYLVRTQAVACTLASVRIHLAMSPASPGTT